MEETKTYFVSFHGYSSDGQLNYYGNASISFKKEEVPDMIYKEAFTACLQQANEDNNKVKKVHLLALNQLT